MSTATSGRELKVSDLVPGMMVRVWKDGRPSKEMKVFEVGVTFVVFQIVHGDIGYNFFALRTGPGLEQITDDDKLRMRVFEL